MTVWHVWTDGSSHHGLHNVPRRKPGWGGWCAIVEHDSDGVVLRGRVPSTTNVRMELKAAIEGLKACPEGVTAKLHTDAMTILSVRDAWRDGIITAFKGPDADLWLELDAEFARVNVVVELIVKGTRDLIHSRAHAIAGAEARGGLKNLPLYATPLMEDGYRIREGMRRAAVKAWKDEQSRYRALSREA